ncbi:T9SS type A sorting domain-containing protein, partial [Polaribacter sp.]|nr:T9SS type A sorting domain-containing protein [Polaribacter sp.]
IVTLLATDIDGDELTYTISNQPSHGSVTLNGNQATYIADGTYVGSDSFTFIAYDGVLNSNEATMSIDVTLDLLTYQLNNIKTYPNPFDDFYFINNPIPLKLQIYDINGKIMFNRNLDIGSNKIDASFLSSGFYILRLSHNNKTASSVLIKR